MVTWSREDLKPYSTMAEKEESSSCSCEDEEPSDLDQESKESSNDDPVNNQTNPTTIQNGKKYIDGTETPSTSSSVENPACTLENNKNEESFNKENIRFSTIPNRNIRSTLPYPCNLGTYKVRAQVTHNDFLYRPGDIVSLLEEDGRIYFAQIRVLIENIYCEKYAALIWLVPNSSEFVQNASFNPYWFVYGPQDENFYKMEAITFVMHAPTPYYKRFLPPVPESSNLIRPEKTKRRKLNKNKPKGFRLPTSVVDLL